MKTYYWFYSAQWQRD